MTAQPEYALYKPGGTPVTSPRPDIQIRDATAMDAGALAGVLATRGGSVDDHRVVAARLHESLAVLKVAEVGDTLSGWSGAGERAIHPRSAPAWLIAGLTVIPQHRRQGIATRLLDAVTGEIRTHHPGAPIFSVVNARNLDRSARAARLFRDRTRAVVRSHQLRWW